MKNILRYIVLALSLAWMVLVIALLPSCSPQHRLNRLLRNHPELLQLRDTITVHDTFIAPAIAADTVFSAKFDTVTLVRDCVRVRIVKHRDTIRLTLTKPADTVVKTVKVPVKVVNATPDTMNWFEQGILFVVVMTVLFALIYGAVKMPTKTNQEYYDQK